MKQIQRKSIIKQITGRWVFIGFVHISRQGNIILIICNNISRYNCENLKAFGMEA
jgi:hypothetical protein